ncbi:MULTISPECIES: UDP-N-acetylglucosamine 2-epimerase (non-hydrolyzing) [Bradyrhizobium]|uniref:UDP-N-acetylglucosamine 2-epimerase (Non-hydrolyzing) n=1 Tax=Bradyrhizobium canariense TaxID=255045 RepID=A0ABX3X2C3_9BRAD|nr:MULTISPECIES: UDP-N-acetylglucosamine 2-epimerase (non-hydrolyzing) [Bradyrhizobium]MCK1438335.1 UDP-N-acetylglucosamine 2-epimerase (non-hydrolyzing) [Bradyrhizobium sp. 15]OSJ14104.1 UDP-N-acetylglucosamine 2-epimerase (non-hydrolyzing) [Bradyrhizobium canariense]OSJ28047.1 UDP-N-acetylglucosamine 2-epimerase (non-hydrolyzing) [Bradyrhizobium canariense]
MTSIATVIGARPQFIKAAPVSLAIAALTNLNELIIHTGQHFDANMSDIFFEELGIARPAHHLGISGGGHGEMTGAMLAALEKIYLRIKPEAVLVYGDTNSTLAGALAATKLHIPVVHVEAGLRSFNRRMPEEQNRIVVDHLSDLLLAPSRIAINNLHREGIESTKMMQVGDVMYDATLLFGQQAIGSSTILNRLRMVGKDYVLATIHRAENTDDPARLIRIMEALRAVADTIPVILPIHPRTMAAIQQRGCDLGRVTIIEPVGYLDMIVLESQASVIATDSGGVQKEAYFHRVPCVTLRDETEWVELVETGWNVLAPPTDAASVAATILNRAGSTGEDTSPYGDGKAAEKVALSMAELLA